MYEQHKALIPFLDKACKTKNCFNLQTIEHIVNATNAVKGLETKLEEKDINSIFIQAFSLAQLAGAFSLQDAIDYIPLLQKINS